MDGCGGDNGVTGKHGFQMTVEILNGRRNFEWFKDVRNDGEKHESERWTF